MGISINEIGNQIFRPNQSILLTPENCNVLQHHNIDIFFFQEIVLGVEGDFEEVVMIFENIIKKFPSISQEELTNIAYLLNLVNERESLLDLILSCEQNAIGQYTKQLIQLFEGIEEQEGIFELIDYVFTNPDGVDSLIHDIINFHKDQITSAEVILFILKTKFQYKAGKDIEMN